MDEPDLLRSDQPREKRRVARVAERDAMSPELEDAVAPFDRLRRRARTCLDALSIIEGGIAGGERLGVTAHRQLIAQFGLNKPPGGHSPQGA